MRLLSLFFSFLFSLQVFAGPHRDEVESLLPAELLSVLKIKDQKEAEALLKEKIYKKEKGEALYLNYFGTKGDVTIGLKGDKIQYLYAEVPDAIQKKDQALFDKALSWLTTKEKEKLAKKDKENTSHEKGRYIVLEIPSESMTLEFYNDEKKALRSVLLWRLGSKAP